MTTRNGHPAVLARNDLLAIADAWPDLLDRLGREGSAAPDGMPKPVSRTPGLVINEYVSQCMADVRDWATFLARVLRDEVTVETPVPGPLRGYTWAYPWAPRTSDTPTMLRQIANERVGHFTEHHDEELRAAFHDDLDEHLAKVKRTAYPDGVRTRTTKVRCDEQGDSPEGARIPCPGFYTFRGLGDGSHPDLICNENRQHRVTPSVWSRSGWRREHDEIDMFSKASTGRPGRRP